MDLVRASEPEVSGSYCHFQDITDFTQTLLGKNGNSSLRAQQTGGKQKSRVLSLRILETTTHLLKGCTALKKKKALKSRVKNAYSADLLGDGLGTCPAPRATQRDVTVGRFL